MFSGVLEGRGSDVAKWLQSQAFELQLFSFFPCSELPSPVASPIRVRPNMYQGSRQELSTCDASEHTAHGPLGWDLVSCCEWNWRGIAVM